MAGSKLRNKVLFAIGCIISIVLGTSTYIYVQDLKRDYFESIEWRSEALVQGILNSVVIIEQSSEYGVTNVRTLFQKLSEQCLALYELYKDKDVTHVATIDRYGTVITHSDPELQNVVVDNEELREHIDRREQVTVLADSIYHTLIPIYVSGDIYIGSIDIGFPKQLVDAKVHDVLWNAAMLFVIFMLSAFFLTVLLMHYILTRPVNRLVLVGQQLARGKLIQTQHIGTRGDEIASLAIAFNRISAYVQSIAEMASRIATGMLNGEVHIRSEHDVLGKSVREMLHYLRDTAAMMEKIAEGDLTGDVPVRSPEDAFGQAMQTMNTGLRNLIEQIRKSATQISSTGMTISSLSANDIGIVKHVSQSAKNMTVIMQEMGVSIEDVANNMDLLSSSVEETSAAVAQLASSSAHIASNTDALARHTRETIASLKENVALVENVEHSTATSQQLARETMRDALNGEHAVEEVRGSMEKLNQTIMTAVEIINRFERRSEDIDTILDVIRGIADQTTLLALNASIIAAQAGSHGRGFAVVADEIRNLAREVTSSTKDIAAIVQALQSDTRDVVQTIHEGADDVKQGLERTQQAQGTLHSILTSAQSASRIAGEIAEAQHQLVSTSHAISAAMEEVYAMTDDITRATNEQKSTTSQINQVVTHINDMASQIQQATTLQLKSLQQVLDATTDVTELIGQNLSSSEHITQTTDTLSTQSAMLLQSVDRFTLES